MIDIDLDLITNKEIRNIFKNKKEIKSTDLNIFNRNPNLIFTYNGSYTYYFKDDIINMILINEFLITNNFNIKIEYYNKIFKFRKFKTQYNSNFINIKILKNIFPNNIKFLDNDLYINVFLDNNKLAFYNIATFNSSIIITDNSIYDTIDVNKMLAIGVHLYGGSISCYNKIIKEIEYRQIELL